jgi:hypothetical protein
MGEKSNFLRSADRKPVDQPKMLWHYCDCAEVPCPHQSEILGVHVSHLFMSSASHIRKPIFAIDGSDGTVVIKKQVPSGAYVDGLFHLVVSFQKILQIFAGSRIMLYKHFFSLIRETIKQRTIKIL